MFSVDYATLSQLIKQYLYTGLFRATTVFSPHDTSKQEFIELSVKDGIVLACRFISARGQIQIWDDWETRLARLGVLDWQLLELSEPPTLPPQQSSARFNSPVPHRNIAVGFLSLDRWPLPHRQVYSLIDGTRSINDIIQLLRKPPELVSRIIEDLGQQGFIKF